MHDVASEFEPDTPDAEPVGLIRPVAPFVFPQWRVVRDQVVGMLLARPDPARIGRSRRGGQDHDAGGA